MYEWYIYAIISNLSFGLTDVFTYNLSTIKQYNSVATNTIFHLAMSILLIFYLLIIFFIYPKYVKTVLNRIYNTFKNHIFVVTLIIFIVFFANSLLYYTFILGNELDNLNPGISSALSNLSIIVSILLAWFFYNKKISYNKFIGIIIFFISIYFLSS